METNYKHLLEEALEFEDYVYGVLLKNGIVSVPHVSQKYQLTGENRGGFEIKHDLMAKKTGNLYIEIAEKSVATRENYFPSGIYREDNGWLYIIGDYNFPLFIFCKTSLKILHKQKRFVETKTPTSMGFLLPVAIGKKYAAKII